MVAFGSAVPSIVVRWEAFVCFDRMATLVQVERKVEQKYYSEVKSTDAKRGLPEELWPCMTIHQSGEVGPHIPVAPECMALIPDAEAARHSRNAVVVKMDENWGR